ncbi:MAG: RNA polymerase sigma factor [Woeseiaceae bacterium]|nr:RNA polymerase sigma factor [Woeseiaceae bacterium]
MLRRLIRTRRRPGAQARRARKPLFAGRHQNDKRGKNVALGAVLATDSDDGNGLAVAVTRQEAGDEPTLIEAARAGSTAAFEALYRLHIGKVYGLCLRMTGNASEAEDCAQDAFLQAWTRLERFRGDSAFGTWLHRVAVNAVLGRMRKSRREQDRLQVVHDTSAQHESIGDSGGLTDIEQALDELPSGARHVFVLHAVYGYSHDETGDMLGIASGTSKAQLHRARRLLAQQLTPGGAAT